MTTREADQNDECMRRFRALFRFAQVVLTWIIVSSVIVSAEDREQKADSPDKQPSAENVKAHIDAGHYEEAEEEARRILALLEARGKGDSLQAADTLDILVKALVLGGKAGQPEARLLAERAVAIHERRLGRDHPHVGRSMNLLGHVFYDKGDYVAAEKHYRRALEIHERAFGPDHPEAAKNLSNIGNALSLYGDLAGARSAYERSLKIFEKSLGTEHPEAAGVLHNLADNYIERGDYAEAEPLLERTLALRRKALGPDHPEVAVTMIMVAQLPELIGDFPRAKRLYEQSIAIQEKAWGPDHPSLAFGLLLLGRLLERMGDRQGARAAMERALTIRQAALGPEHPMCATALRLLGGLLFSSGETREAERLLSRALAIEERTLGPDHREVAEALDELGRAAEETGDEPRARRLWERALSVKEKALGLHHPDVAETLVALARLSDPSDSAPRPSELLERALSIQERAFGPGNPFSARTLVALAGRVAATGEIARAVKFALDAEEAAREHVRVTVRGLGERQALLYATVRFSGLDLALTLLAEHPHETAAQRRDVLDAIVRSRAIVLDEMATRHRTAARTRDSEVERLAKNLTLARDRLARIAVRGLGEGPYERYRKILGDARLEKERAEEALAARSAAFREERSLAAAGLDEVERSLPARATLLSFVRHARTRADQDASDAVTQSAVYDAFVFKAGQEPEIIPLGMASDIDNAVARWRKALDWEAQAPGLAPKRSLARYFEAAGALRQRVWDPVAPHLKGAATVFVVPDGSLHFVNLTALPLDDGRFLVESGPALHVLSTERDLAAKPTETASAGLLLVGAPDFTNGRMRASADGFRGTKAACDEFREIRFPPLPFADRELESIGALWMKSLGTGADASPPLVFQGLNADEAAFKDAAPGRRMIHLATHGFMLGGSCSAAEGNPLLRSGLALAGANRRKEARSDVEDGVLTAEEIAAMDLSGVEWAVLSACETGLGEIREGEGVFGLRRAFQVAGAHSVIMSLWPVADESTRAWMENLYRHRLEDRLSTVEAVRQASLDVLRRRRNRGQTTHPLYWAGFVAVGDWR
jgi:CHAT domain-containing protein/Tfp pilus assembly protein PilF